MKKKGIKSSRSKMFLLVAMVTLTVMTTTTTTTTRVMAETVDGNENNQQQNENETKDSLNVNETEGDGTIRLEREKSPHELTITNNKNGAYYGTQYNYVTCQGENVKSISAILCETMEVCEEKKSCFVDPKKCSGGPRVMTGGTCSSEDENIKRDMNGNGASLSCLQVQISSSNQLRSGIVQCTSSSEEEGGLNLTTFDHFTIGHSQAQLLTIKNVTRDMIEMKLSVSSLSSDLNDPNVTLGQEMVTLFVDEVVSSLQCNAPSFLFHKEQLIIRAHKKDGSILKLGPQTTSFENSRNVLISTLTNFRVPVDLVGFSCSAQPTNSRGEWLENRIHVKVQGFPLQVIVKSSESRNMTLNLTSGAKVNLQCGLTGSPQQKERIRREMIRLNAHDSELKPVIEFLRFHQVAGKYLICKHQLGVEHSEDGVGFIYTFNLAPSAPEIYKPLHENNKPISSQVHLIYEDVEVVDQTLLCSFNGDPKPVITWMKNGQELGSVKSFAIRQQGDKMMNHIKLQVNAKMIHSSDFGPENPQVNLSCVANNYFGSDRLDFIFMAATEFEKYLIKPETTAVTITNPAETATTFALVVVLLNLSFVVLLSICLIFWKVWKTRRVRPCTHSEERTQVFKFQNNSGNDGEESP